MSQSILFLLIQLSFITSLKILWFSWQFILLFVLYWFPLNFYIWLGFSVIIACKFFFEELSFPRKETLRLLPQESKLGHQDSQKQWGRVTSGSHRSFSMPTCPQSPSAVCFLLDEGDAWLVGWRSDLGISLHLVQALNQYPTSGAVLVPLILCLSGALWGWSVSFLPPLCTPCPVAESLIARYLLSSCQHCVHISLSIIVGFYSSFVLEYFVAYN